MVQSAHGEPADRGVMSAGPGTKPGTDHSVDTHGDHPGELVYIKIAVILTVITAIEVVIYYVDALASFLVAMLIVLSIAKFAIVVGYFMHLKFDDRRFSYMFVSGLLIAVSVFLAVGALFFFHAFAIT